MIFKIIYLYFRGYVEIKVEGFFVERFLNICKSKNIEIWNLKRENSSTIILKVSLKDFKQIKNISTITQSKMTIESKKGVPFLINKYRKRKIFAITLLVIAILIFIMTRFVWNIQINGLNNIKQEDILNALSEEGISLGKLRAKIDVQNSINNIRIKFEEVAWIGIEEKGTNMIINIVEAEKKPEIIDENIRSNIIAKKDSIITKLNVQNGTAMRNVGDLVKKGEIIVEGIMEGKYTDVRYVNSKADIYGKVWYSGEAEKKIKEEKYELTGNQQKNYKIKINNFKINLNKGVSKFENYDTITTNKKIKIFSNIYIPVEIIQTTYREKDKKIKEYTKEDLIDELKEEVRTEIITREMIDTEKILEVNYDVQEKEDSIIVKVTIVVEENIAEENVF